MSVFKHCPFCGKDLKEKLKYPYECPDCRKNIYRETLRDRALNRCTAVHAEDKAIINSRGRDLNGCTLYVTTFPCFSCAQKILDVGIENICYVESYPDLESIELLEKSNISVKGFEGVKANAYVRIFGPWRGEQERKLLERTR